MTVLSKTVFIMGLVGVLLADIWYLRRRQIKEEVDRQRFQETQDGDDPDIRR